MSSTYMDSDPEKKRYLLEMMSIGLLDRDGAIQLKQLLQKEMLNIHNIQHKRRLQMLINTLEDYISGKIDLMIHPDAVPSNIT